MDQYSRNSPLEVNEQQLLGKHHQAIECMDFLGTFMVLQPKGP